ncbi:uncharacterized protein [Leptinotarsa decemlineata]|uniref:uncharacterized protein n=1 Tax=Leptinotarsa decemlineata TaxID=7539 RepID=UPI000C255890|nr:fibroblast growth factor receptor substrate 2 [Leptinotarsa decemlineata]
MGCVSSKTDINDRHPNIFQVTNVNDLGRPISPGKLQVTETELVFYQRGKKPTKWPLRSLRKYGFDTEVFSFECGRRCPTGHGIYAFKCKKAEQLFNIVQHHITGNINDEVNVSSTAEFSTNGPPIITRRPNTVFQTEGYLNPIVAPAPTRPFTMISRPGSVSSNGPLSPTAISPPPDLPVEHNNNKRSSLVPEPSYTNTSVVENGSIQFQYANMAPSEPTLESSCHVYMNVDTNCTKDLHDLAEEVEERHCYANIDNSDIETLRPLPASIPPTPTTLYCDLENIGIREVNYAELDLNAKESVVPLAAPETPTVEKKSYATIDFQKTTALSQSINPRMTVEEGIRKTRHNSTIHYNNSLSD